MWRTDLSFGFIVVKMILADIIVRNAYQPYNLFAFPIFDVLCYSNMYTGKNYVSLTSTLPPFSLIVGCPAAQI